MRGCRWAGLQHLDPRGKVADGFQIGRAVAGVLARPLPVGEGLRCEPGLRVMMRHQFRLGCSGLGKLRRQRLGNALMVLLAGAPQQGLIRHILDTTACLKV